MEQEAAVALAPSLEISSTRLALIPHYSQEILCYELRGTADGQEYLVYLNAETGAAEENPAGGRRGGGRGRRLARRVEQSALNVQKL